MRVYSVDEQNRLGPECLGFLHFLETCDVLPAHMREVVIERAMASGSATLGLDDLKIAPFHILASEGAVHDDQDHLWHLSLARRLAEVEPRLFLATQHVAVDLADPASEARAIDWWHELVGRGGEGMVVKPRSYLARGKHGLVQPAIKCRGPEYLRIIYGPEYLEPESLERLRPRGLGHKRSMAARELALGLEALHRFVAREGLSRVHECVFGVLALESEPVDPRL